MTKSISQERKDALRGVLQFRQSIYLFLSRVFSREADESVLASLEDIRNMMAQLADSPEFADDPDVSAANSFLSLFLAQAGESGKDALLESLAREYAFLFLGVGSRTVALCESVYRGGGKRLYDDVYFDVKQEYASSGAAKREDFPEPEDHLAVEMAYMAHLCGLSQENLDSDGTEEAAELARQKAFFEVHLLSWIPALSERLLGVSESVFYSAMANLLRVVINLDARLLAYLNEEVNA